MTDLTAAEAYRDLAHRRACDSCDNPAHRYNPDQARVNGDPYATWLAAEQLPDTGPEGASPMAGTGTGRRPASRPGAAHP